MKKTYWIILMAIFIVSIGGTVNAATLPIGGIRTILNMSESHINPKSITEIEFSSSGIIPDTAINSWSVNDNINAWITEYADNYTGSNDPCYYLHIGSDEILFAPIDCTNYFSYLFVRNISFYNFDTQNVTNMGSMFYGCSELKLLSLNSFNTENVIRMSGMFSGCTKLIRIDLSNFSTEHVVGMENMFGNCYALEEITLPSVGNQVKSTFSMFYNCRSLERITIIGENEMELLNSTSAMFSGCKSLKEVDLTAFNISNVKIMSEMFYGCSNLETIKIQNFNDITNMTDISRAFSLCEDLDSIIFYDEIKSSGDVHVFWDSDFFELEKIPTIYVKDDEAETLYEANEDYLNMFGADKIKVYKTDATLEETLFGDMDHDGKITIVDVRLLLQAYINHSN